MLSSRSRKFGAISSWERVQNINEFNDFSVAFFALSAELSNDVGTVTWTKRAFEVQLHSDDFTKMTKIRAHFFRSATCIAVLLEHRRSTRRNIRLEIIPRVIIFFLCHLAGFFWFTAVCVVHGMHAREMRHEHRTSNTKQKSSSEIK